MFNKNLITMKLPSGHQALMPYLILHDAGGFIRFAKAVLAAEQTFERMREDGKTLMHAELNVAGSTLMCAEASSQWPAQPASLFVYVPDADTAYQQALSLGASTIMELSDQDYGRTCGVQDPYGNIWWMTSL